MFQLSHATKQLELARAPNMPAKSSLNPGLLLCLTLKWNEVSSVSTWPNRLLQTTARRGECVVSPGPVGWGWGGVALSALGGFWSDGNGRGSCWVAAQITVAWEEQGWWVTCREARHPSLLSAPGHSTDHLPPSLRCPCDRMIDLLYLQMGEAVRKDGCQLHAALRSWIIWLTTQSSFLVKRSLSKKGSACSRRKEGDNPPFLPRSYL